MHNIGDRAYVNLIAWAQHWLSPSVIDSVYLKLYKSVTSDFI